MQHNQRDMRNMRFRKELKMLHSHDTEKIPIPNKHNNNLTFQNLRLQRKEGAVSELLLKRRKTSVQHVERHRWLIKYTFNLKGEEYQRPIKPALFTWAGCFPSCPERKRPQGRPRTWRRDYISHWERLSILPEETVEVVRETMVWSPGHRLPLPLLHMESHGTI